MYTAILLLASPLFIGFVAYYTIKCINAKYIPLNIYTLMPASGALTLLAAAFLSFAFPNPTLLIFGAIILNVILLIIDMAAHFHDYESVPFAICDYVAQAIMTVLVIMSFGIFVAVIVFGINIISSKIK